jgi:hypothetical protein
MIFCNYSEPVIALAALRFKALLHDSALVSRNAVIYVFICFSNYKLKFLKTAYNVAVA